VAATQVLRERPLTYDNTRSRLMSAPGVKLIGLAEAEGFEPPNGLPSPAFKFYASPFTEVRERTSCLVEEV
jgi:hypothetical protein